MVDSALFADDTCLKQQCLRKRCFSGIYMGENANDGILIHIDSNPICFVVSFILCVKKADSIIAYFMRCDNAVRCILLGLLTGMIIRYLFIALTSEDALHDFS